MGENCKDCKVWEEEIYWTHFQSIHFSQFLHAGFQHRLAIPEKFSKNCKKKLPKTVTLNSPSGTTYEVELATENDKLVFCNGWEEFVKDHFLEQNDLLVFKFNGVSNFDVLMFDGQSLCEKASSYFVRKCGHEEHGSGRHEKRKVADYSATSSSCGTEGAPKKPTNDIIDLTPIQEPLISPAANEKMSPGKYPLNAFWTMQRVRSDELSNLGTDVDIKPDIRRMPVSTKMACSSSKHSTKRRLVTDSDKRNALFLAKAATTDEGFMVVMKRSHVHFKFYLTIPNKWILKHMSKDSQEVVLRMNNRTWCTGFNYIRNKNYGGISSGWRKFVVDNNLDEFDVCVFEPTSPITKPLIIDVSIFRVVQGDSL